MMLRRLIAFFLLALFLSACAAPMEAVDGAEASAPVAPRSPGNSGGPALLAANADVRTIQLYASSDERRLPVLSLESGGKLTLEFDLMAPTGRVLSVYFYHADRSWSRDLMPIEYMRAFHREDLVEFNSSHGDNRYVHYRYEFPTPSIDFRISGNYILRVTESGKEDQVLFERPFFVTEQRLPVEMGIEQVPVSGSTFPATSPSVRFNTSDPTLGSVYDYNVCFVRNGRLEQSRCTSRPSLLSQPYLNFYLEPREAFPAEPDDYYLNVSSFRPGGDIESVDLSKVPYEVHLDPDYVRFAGSSVDPDLQGQIVTARVPGDADYSGEYARVRFALVPVEGTALSGDLRVVGSFNGWQTENAPRLYWVAERSRYEGEVLLKQGEYQYRYTSTDARMRSMLRQAPPTMNDIYTALVYFRDQRVGTDRLLSVSAVRSL